MNEWMNEWNTDIWQVWGSLSYVLNNSWRRQFVSSLVLPYCSVRVWVYAVCQIPMLIFGILSNQAERLLIGTRRIRKGRGEESGTKRGAGGKGQDSTGAVSHGTNESTAGMCRFLGRRLATLCWPAVMREMWRYGNRSMRKWTSAVIGRLFSGKLPPHFYWTSVRQMPFI